MNKLEELIEEKVKAVFRTDIGDNPFSGSFIAGTMFIKELDLPVKFAEWMDRNVAQFGLDIYRHNGISYESIAALYDLWINNVYDGK